MSLSSDVLKNNLTNPARSWLWDVVFTNPIGGGDAASLETRCRTVSIPGRSFGRITLPFKGTPGIVFPGKLNMDHTWSMTFIESSADRKTFDAIYNWKQAIINDKTGVGAPDITIKSDIYLKCLDQTGAVWLTIKVIGCYPEVLGEVSLSQESQEEIKFSVRWAYDRWEKV